MKTLVIKDSEWLRGTGEGVLYDPETERMCCLGIHAVACGIGKEYLYNIALPGGIPNADANLPDDYQYWREHYLEAEHAASINDEAGIEDKERIKRLQDLFTLAGYKLEFRPEE